MGQRISARWLALLAAVTLVATACSEDEDGGEVAAPEATTTSAATAGTEPEPTSLGARFSGKTTLGELPSEPVKATGEPIKVGMINQENTPLGSFPEVRLAAEAAVAFVNEELGGVDGRPIELVTCITEFSPESSQRCANQMVQTGVVAVTPGIDVTSDSSVPILEQNGIPLVGGIPVNYAELRSPLSFIFGGGTPGALAAFSIHAAEELGATKVSIMYGEFAPIEESARRYGAELLEELGVTDVTLVPFPIVATDFVAPLTAAAEGDPDAIFVAAADRACAPVMKTALDLGITAQLYLVGACAGPTQIEAAGDGATGRLFNTEGPVSGDDQAGPDTELYDLVIEEYGQEGLAPRGAGTVSFRAVMNLWMIMRELGADDVTPESLTEALRASEATPSFNGHPYTCDGQQIPDLPALCAPQQILMRYDGTDLVQETEAWIDVPAYLG